MINKQSGFSLIEVFVALALMGILGVASVEMLQQQNKSQLTTEASFDALDLAGDVRAVLSGSVSCEKTLEGVNFANGTQITQITRSLKDPSTPGAYIDTPYLRVNDQRGQRIKIKSMTLVAVDAPKGLGSIEIVAESLSADAKQYKKTIPLIIIPDKVNPGQVGSCVAVGGPPVDPVELCAMTGGTANSATGKCQIEVDLDTGVLPTYCPPGSKITFEQVNGKPRMKCEGCATQQVFDHWECGKPFSGMNWVNMCFYRTVCQNNHSIVLFGATWDQKRGPTDASGGDTGTAKNCRKKRERCWGE